MSYSIGARRASKAELEIAISAELSRVPETQPAHTQDIDQAFNAAQALIDLMSDDPNRDLYCSVSGSIWVKDGGIEQVGVNVSVAYQTREK